MSDLDKVIGRISETLNTGEFEWRINDSSEKVYAVETGEYLRSPTFSFSFCSWYVRMYPNGDGSSCKEWTSLFLYRKETQSEKYVSFSLVMTFQGIQLASHDLEHFFKKNEMGWGRNMILSKTVLHHWSKETKSRNQLILKIRLRIFHDESALPKVRTKDIDILCQNYKDLLFEGKDHDLVVKVKDKEFKVHRNIMQCRCSIFNTMLTHEMLEKRRGVVEIPDCDDIAFEQFLIYVYTGDLDTLDESNMLSLYYIADKYDMVHLKEYCCTFIKKSLSSHNAGDIIGLALDHIDASLLEFTTEYFVKNVKEILPTVGWQSFIKDHPIEANELFIKTISNFNLHLLEETVNEAPTE